MSPAPACFSQKDTPFVLASLDIGWLWLMAAVSVVAHCTAMVIWIPVRRFRIAYPFIMVGCGIATIVLGWQARGFTVAQMLVLVSFALIGLTIGLLPLRKLFMASAYELSKGAPGGNHKVPFWRLAFCVGVVTIALLVSFVLTR